MVTLIQCQQTADNNLHQKEQDRRTISELSQQDSSNNSSNCRVKLEQLQSSKDNNNTVITAANCNGVINGTTTQCSDIDNKKNVVDCCANNGRVVEELEEEEEEEEEDDDDDDDDEDENDTDFEEEKWTKDLPVSTVVRHQQQIVVPNGNVVLPNADPSTFGDICVKNSTNVHLGNKTLYKGPVTIRQFIYSNPTSVDDKGTTEYDGPRTSDANASDTSLGKTGNGLSRPILSQKSDYERVKNWLWTWRCAALLCTIALIVVTTIVVASVLLTNRHDVSPTLVFPEIPDSSLEGVIVSNVRFVQRNEWGAQPPTEPLEKLKLPVPYVIISHTVTEFCTTQSECTLHVRVAQTFHIESKKWSDIAYNFLVGGDGLAYVGRSWDYIGAHSFGYNNKSIGISFIGTFNSVVPPKSQLHAAQKIIELGVKSGKIAKDYKLLGHRQISKTLSPGDALYATIKTWPHWAPQP